MKFHGDFWKSLVDVVDESDHLPEKFEDGIGVSAFIPQKTCTNIFIP